MRTRVAGGLVLAVVIALAGAGCATLQHKSPADGGVAGGEYTNSFFGFALPIPNGWSVAPQEALNATVKMGSEMLTESADKRVKAALKAAEKKTHNLMLMSEHPLGAAVPFNANIIGVAELVRHTPGVKTGADYLFHMRNVLKMSNVGLQSRGEPKETQLGKRTFYHEQYYSGTTSPSVEQAYYVTVLDGYALALIVSAASQDDLPRVEATLKDLRFQ